MVFESIVKAVDALLNINLFDLAILAGLGAILGYIAHAFRSLINRK